MDSNRKKKLAEATMSVNIGGVPRPFRVISKEQGKDEYGAPFYEEVSQEAATAFSGLADKIKKEQPDIKTARGWIKDAFTRLGLEPVEKVGFLTDLMKYKKSDDLADALYDMTMEIPGAEAEPTMGMVVGEEHTSPYKIEQTAGNKWQVVDDHGTVIDEFDKRVDAVRLEKELIKDLLKTECQCEMENDKDMQHEEAQEKFESHWDAIGEKGREDLLKRAGYDGEELDAYSKFEWGNIPPAVRTHLEVVLEGVYEAIRRNRKPNVTENYNPGGADIRLPFHGPKTAKAPVEPEEDEEEEEEPGDEEPEEPEKKKKGEEGSAVFESEQEYVSFFRNYAGLKEADQPHHVSSEKPEVLALVSKAKDGDKAAQGELFKKYEGWLKSIVHKVAANSHMPKTDEDELFGEATMMFLQKVLPSYNPAKGSLSNWISRVLSTELTKAARKIYRERGHGMGSGEDEPTPTDVAAAVSASEELPKECKTKLKAAIDKLDARSKQVLTLRFGLGGDKPLDLRSVAEIMKSNRQTVSQWERAAIDKLLDMEDVAEVWKVCKDFLSREGERAPLVPKRRRPELEKEELEALAINMTFEWPHEQVAESIENILQLEGVAVKRNGKKVTVRVNEYSKVAKAFERHGLSAPKRYVSREAENIRHSAKLSGQMGSSMRSTMKTEGPEKEA